jgi:hypothetical protein
MSRPIPILLSALALCSAGPAFAQEPPASPFKLGGEMAPPAVKPGQLGHTFSPDGFLRAVAADGKVAWERSLLEEYGIQLDPAKAAAPLELGNSGSIVVRAARRVAGGLEEYCFQFDDRTGELLAAVPARLYKAAEGKAGKEAALRDIPAEFSLHTGQGKVFDVVSVDRDGAEVDPVDEPLWKLAPAGFARLDPLAAIPPSTEVAFDAFGKLEIAEESRPRVFTLEAARGKLKGATLGRVLPNLPIYNGFESMPAEEPPAYWIGARNSWEVIVQPGAAGKVLRPLAQKGLSTVFLAGTANSEYTIQADIQVPEPNGDVPGAIALLNQRFMAVVELDTGNVSLGRLFEYPVQVGPLVNKAGIWTLQFRVEADPEDATQALLLARLWPQGQTVPEDWSLRAKLPLHGTELTGAPGLLHTVANEGVWVDNIRVQR